MAGKWVAAVLLVVVVVGKWAEHAWVSGQPVRLSAWTVVGPGSLGGYGR